MNEKYPPYPNSKETTIKATCNSEGCGKDIDLVPDSVLVMTAKEGDLDSHRYMFNCPECKACVIKPTDDETVGLFARAGVRVRKIPDELHDVRRQPSNYLEAEAARSEILDGLIALHSLRDAIDDNLADTAAGGLPEELAVSRASLSRVQPSIPPRRR